MIFAKIDLVFKCIQHPFLEASLSDRLIEYCHWYSAAICYKLQVLLRTERATALITQKVEKENTER